MIMKNEHVRIYIIYIYIYTVKKQTNKHLLDNEVKQLLNTGCHSLGLLSFLDL